MKYNDLLYIIYNKKSFFSTINYSNYSILYIKEKKGLGYKVQKQNRPPAANEKNRNTSYYKSRVGKKTSKEKSDFLEIAKRRQMNSYKWAMLVLGSLMVAFAGLILLGAFLKSLVVQNEDGTGTGVIGIEKDPGADIFTAREKDTAEILFPAANPTAEPVQSFEISDTFLNYNGAYLDVSLIESLDDLQSFIDGIKARGINAVSIDIKKEDGSVPFHINGQTDAVAGTENYISIPAADIIKLLHDNELYISGTIACFRDNIATVPFVNYALRSSSASAARWEDPEGNFWLNPYSKGAREYISGIVEDSVRLGFDEIILNWFFFPDVANPKAVLYEDEGAGKYETVKNFIAEQRHALDNIAPKVKLGLYIPITYFIKTPNENMGINPGELSEWCNFFATSFAPADVPQGAAINGEIIKNPENDPYGTVKNLCDHFKYISEKTNLRPYLQAFNGYGGDAALRQQQALRENGINIWLLVNYENDY